MLPGSIYFVINFPQNVPLKYATHKSENVSVILSTKQYTVVTEAAL